MIGSNPSAGYARRHLFAALRCDNMEPTNGIFYGDSTVLTSVACNGMKDAWAKCFYGRSLEKIESEVSLMLKLEERGLSEPKLLKWPNGSYVKATQTSNLILYTLLISGVQGRELDKTNHNQLLAASEALGKLHKKMKMVEIMDYASQDRPFLDEHKVIGSQMYKDQWKATRKIYRKLPRQLIHGDVNPSNLLYSDGKVKIIDFSDVRMGIPEEDFVHLLVMHKNGTLSELKQLLNIYEMEAENTLNKRLFMPMATYESLRFKGRHDSFNVAAVAEITR